MLANQHAGVASGLLGWVGGLVPKALSHRSAEAAPMVAEDVEFGFVPKQVVLDLQDIGNWKSRATAIDALQKCIREVQNKTILVPGLAELVKFLVGLIADPNFKIAISSMNITGDLATKLGTGLGPHLNLIVPALMEKFVDSKILVRSANMKALRKLMGCCSPDTMFGLLAPGLAHSSWRVREEVVNTYIVALLNFGVDVYIPQKVLRVLVGAMNDSKDKVRLVALEGIAVLGQRLGSKELQYLLAKDRVADGTKAQIVERLNNPALPSINGDGMV